MEPAKNKSTVALWALWFAMFQALAVYLAAGYFIRINSGAPEPPVSLGVLAALLTALSAGMTAVNFLVMPKLASKMQETAYYLTRWALAEAIGIYGLILFLMGASWVVFGAFIGAAMAVMIALKPDKPA